MGGVIAGALLTSLSSLETAALGMAGFCLLILGILYLVLRQDGPIDPEAGSGQRYEDPYRLEQGNWEIVEVYPEALATPAGRIPKAELGEGWVQRTAKVRHRTTGHVRLANVIVPAEA